MSKTLLPPPNCTGCEPVGCVGRHPPILASVLYGEFGDRSISQTRSRAFMDSLRANNGPTINKGWMGRSSPQERALKRVAPTSVFEQRRYFGCLQMAANCGPFRNHLSKEMTSNYD